MLHRSLIVSMTLLFAGGWAGAEVFVGPGAPERDLGIVQNASFDRGGMSYADHWRPLPGLFRMHRRLHDTGEHSLFLQLRRDGDGGVIQTVDLPARRELSLRVLATLHSDSQCAVVVTLVRVADGAVLAEVAVDGITRGVLAQGFETGPGGPAELMVRVVGEAGGRALVDRVTIAPPVEERHARSPDYSGRDLVLAPGAGLRVDADFEPRLLPQAAVMLQEAIKDMTGSPTTRVGASVTVSVDEPPATQWPQRESYRLTVGDSGVTIGAPSERGAMWGMMTLIDLIRPEPDGGVRVVAVDARNEPALPWRIGAVHGADAAENAARKLARLKLNMALTSHAEESMVAALRDVGIEPVIVISGDAADGLAAAMGDVVERLDVQYLFVSPPVVEAATPGTALPWSEEPLREVAAFAGRHRDDVTVIVPAAARTPRHSSISAVPIAFDGWPREIVAAVHPSSSADQGLARLRELDAAGVRSIIYHFEGMDGVTRALTARAEGLDCAGVLATGDAARAADRAWKGSSGEE